MNKKHYDYNYINGCNMHDAHFHLFQGQLPFKSISQGIINTQTLEEFQQAQNLKKAELLISFGLHPWDEVNDLSIYMECFEACDFIGEIGMDCVWSNVALEKQKRLFEQQLQLAIALKKAVILHTKGCEKEVYSLIQKYPNTYLVHWFASEDWIEQYLTLDTYFSISTSVGYEEEVNRCLKKIPINRLLLESDGLEAIGWVLNKKIESIDYKKEMLQCIERIAMIKQVSVEILYEQLNLNYQIFLKKVREELFIEGK